MFSSGHEPNCVRGKGTLLRVGTELCVWKKDFGSGENQFVCVEDGYFLDDNICLCMGDDLGISA